MGITLNIHKTHRRHTEGLEAVEVDGRTVGECLERLMERFPAMRGALFQGQGKLNHQIEIYLNMESAYPDELKKPVKAGDEIFITLMLAGG